MYRTLSAILIASAGLVAGMDGIFQANLWSGAGCTGSVNTVYITGDNINPGSLSESYCFTNAPGQSFNDFEVADGWCTTTIDAGTYGDFSLTTYAGSNCDGDNLGYGEASDDCVENVFGSVLLGCTNYY